MDEQQLHDLKLQSELFSETDSKFSEEINHCDPNSLNIACQLYLKTLAHAGQQNEETQVDAALIKLLEKIITHTERFLEHLPTNIASNTKNVITKAWKDPTFLKSNYQNAQTFIDMPVYDTIEKDLAKIVAQYFPDEQVSIYKFGSRIAGIGTDTSDLDIFVGIGSSFEICEWPPSDLTHFRLSTVHEAMLESNKWRIIKVVKNAYIPIIRAVHLKSNIYCDIGFSNSISHCNSNLIKYLTASQTVAQYMCIFLKKWLQNNKFTYQITTHCITLMVIYFLQIEGLLPSIEQLHSELPSKQFVGPWIVNFPQKSLNDLGCSSKDVTTSLVRMYLKHFFIYYATFHYEKYAICPYFGLDNVLIKQLENSLPQSYLDYVKQNPTDALKLNRPMVVVDTMQLNDNAAQMVTQRGLRLFSECCRQTASFIAEIEAN